MARGLSKKFMDELLSGTLKELLEFVQRDDTLDLEIRREEVHIYYRGGKILGLKPKKTGYTLTFDNKYLKALTSNSKITEGMLNYSRENHEWEKYFAYTKCVIDMYFNIKGRYEREFQQVVARVNNYSKISNSTDYFIIDIEYANGAGARFDIVALEWVATTSSRKKPDNCRLVVFEMKYGDGALTKKAGIEDHLRKFEKFIINKSKVSSFKTEMLHVFKQKRELGLVIFGKNGNSNEVKKVEEEIDFAFIIANHQPASLKLKREIGIAAQDYDFKLIIANFMGYGLYKECLYSLEDFLVKFPKQIYSGKK
ncbi:MAG: hypothetical protein RAO94_08960 [Candidatus Stygibacter australis]|nr:hypothetical protein [Candidatus Stygibacter australis]MDP8322465.1 hypothetical protein [Candidatus Stygibacter australis]